MRIATWNVNSVKARLPNVLEWLDTTAPDVALLQEIKCEAAAFPASAFEELGYAVAIAGQKSYNGVALLARGRIEDILPELPGAPCLAGQDAPQARYVEATVGTLRLASLYVPNGNPPGDGEPSDKYRYKLAWLEALHRHVIGLLATEQTFVLGGDFNVIPAEEDCTDPAAWADDALFLLETRRRFRALQHLGLTEAFRALHPRTGGAYTFWDYQGRAWEADNGIRIDHFLVSPQAADRLEDCAIDKAPRGRPKASDHTPVVLTLRGD